LHNHAFCCEIEHGGRRRPNNRSLDVKRKLGKEVSMSRTAKDLEDGEALAYRPWRTMDSFRHDPAARARRELAWSVARESAALLKSRYGAARVVAFGSIERERGFTPWSDLDLAAWGMAPAVYYEALGDAMELGSEQGLKVDLVDMAHCPSLLRQEIEQEGVEL